MTPAELKQLSIKHLQGVLGRTANPMERAKIEQIIAEERDKPESAFPASTGARR
jgi:hypothetical protein